MLHSVTSSFPAVYEAEFFGVEAANDCTPPADAPNPSAALVAQGLSDGECIRSVRASNLDLNDKLVKRGLSIYWCGFRGKVQRVRAGRCLVVFFAHGTFVYPVGSSVSGKWLACASVQVIAS